MSIRNNRDVGVYDHDRNQTLAPRRFIVASAIAVKSPISSPKKPEGQFGLALRKHGKLTERSDIIGTEGNMARLKDKSIGRLTIGSIEISGFP